MNTAAFHSVVVKSVWAFALLAAPLAAQTVDRLTGTNVSVAQVTFKGRSAVQLIAKPEAANASS